MTSPEWKNPDEEAQHELRQRRKYNNLIREIVHIAKDNGYTGPVSSWPDGPQKEAALKLEEEAKQIEL